MSDILPEGTGCFVAAWLLFAGLICGGFGAAICWVLMRVFWRN